MESNESPILRGLNPAQYDAVVNYDAPSLIIAGAGSGKTRVLTSRIAYMIEQGVAPFNILALTFTNKAAKEMLVRLEARLARTRARQNECALFGGRDGLQLAGIEGLKKIGRHAGKPPAKNSEAGRKGRTG